MPENETPKIWLPSDTAEVCIDLDQEQPERVMLQQRILMTLQPTKTEKPGYGRN